MCDSLSPIEPIVLNPDFATTRMVVRDGQDSLEESSADKDSLKVGGLRTQGYSKQSCTTAAGLDYPLVTIITVVYNNDRYLETTISSVLAQSYDNLEYIIVDGGSTDGTLDIIRQYEDRIDYWISEPDEGLYDAMNKGVGLAEGEIIGILNSDDLYFVDTVAWVVEAYRQQQPSVIYGSMRRFVDEENAIVTNRGDLSDRAFDTATIVINHPTCFVPRSLYQDFGGFKQEYEVGADRELMMRFHRQGVKFINLERSLSLSLDWVARPQTKVLSSIVKREIVQEYQLLSAHNVKKIAIAKVMGKKTLQGLRKWLLYRILGEKLANKILMSYIGYKFSRPSERLTNKSD